MDAICINQNDEIERSQQVSVTHQIYNWPHTMVAYVGPKPEEHHSEEAMGLLRNPAELKARKLDEFQLSSINHLIRRPYFQRMWERY